MGRSTSVTIFDDRASYYARYRPQYPASVLDILQRLVPPPADAADIAAGTGILSRKLASRGYRTVAVEPNHAMRGEITSASGSQDIRVFEGTGEATNLPSDCVDLITVAQAFHWLDPTAALAEFRRIGRPGCLAGFVWNTRRFTATPFMRDYHAVLTDHAPEYSRMKTKWANLHERVKGFFPSWTLEAIIDNPQRWDLGALLGNLWSTSYVPQAGVEGHDAMLAAAERLFEKHSADGYVDFMLRTIIVVGPVEG